MQNEVLNILNNYREKIKISRLQEMLKHQIFIAYIFKKNNFPFKNIKVSNFDIFKKDIYSCLNKNNFNEKFIMDNLQYLYDSAFYESNKNILDFLNRFDKYDLVSLETMFEFLLSHDFSKSDYYENTTSLELIKLIDLMTQNNVINNILDICSGYGNFLTYFTNNRNIKKSNGIELIPTTYFVSIERLIIRNSNSQIINDDALQQSFEANYDLVFCNHPWMLKYGNPIKKDKINKLDNIDMSKMRADWGFISKAINSTNENGKAFVLIPNGCLASINSNEKKIRKVIIENGLLEYVISMPNNTLNYTSAKYSMLVFSKENDNITFVDATHCYKSSSKGHEIDANRIFELINNSTNSNVKRPKLDEIRKKEYNLNVDTYFRKEIELPNAQSLKKYAELFRGYQYISKNDLELEPGKGEYSIVKIKDLDSNILKYDELSTMDLEPEKVNRFCLKDGDILITTKASILKIVLVENIQDRKVIPTGNLTVIRITNTDLNPTYLYTFLNGSVGNTIIQSLQTGSVIMNIPKKSLEEMKIPLLDKDTQEVICNKFKILNAELINLERKIKNIQNKITDIYSDEVGD